jgi:uncharacterized protein YuzE
VNLKTDTENNVAYLYMREIQAGEVDRTVTVHSMGGSHVNLDFDSRGALLGIEFLDAETQLKALREDLSSPEGNWGPEHPSYDEMGQ